MVKLNFPFIADPEIVTIPIIESNEALVNLEGLSPYIQIDERYKLNNPDCSKVRLSVARKLMQASKLLPDKLNFLIIEGYRPLSIQTAIYTSYYQKLARANPQWLPDKIRAEATQYVSPPDINPPHTTGGAIDVTLVDKHGHLLAMGTDTEDKPHENEFRNYTYASNITLVEKTNRQILIGILNAVGFINYPAEWWHWSYGDRYWAYHTGSEQAIFGSVSQT